MKMNRLTEVLDAVRRDKYDHLDGELVSSVLDLHQQAAEGEGLIGRTRQVLQDWIREELSQE